MTVATRLERAGKQGSPGRLGPPVPAFRVVERQRLLDRVSRAVEDVPFTLISAPAGTGKTVLTAAWATRHGQTRPVAWLSLSDARDADVWRHDVADRLLQLDEPLVLVLDAAEHVRQHTVFDQLSELLDTTGEQLRVLMTTRADPPMPLHRYRLEGKLAEIRLDELAFTDAEVEELLELNDSTMPDGPTRDVLDRAEGWAAGVRLAALASRPGGQAVPLDALVADYLLAEVFDQLDDPDRDFLVRTSVVEDLTPELAAALTARSDAGELLKRMSYGNTFVRPVPGWPGHYRVHPLFREFLSARLVSTLPGAVHGLHGRAAAWYSTQGQLVPAVRHATETGDWARAAAMVVRGHGVADLMLPTPVGAALAGHLAAMPDLDTGDVQLVRAAMAIGRNELEPAQVRLARSRAEGSVSHDWPLSAAVVTTWMYDRLGRVEDALLAAGEVSKELAGRADADARLRLLRALALSAEGSAHLAAGNLDVACTVLRDAVQTATAADCDDVRLRCVATLALAEVCRGQLSQGQGLADTADRLARERGVAAARRPAAAQLAHAWVALERKDLTRAQRSLDQADGVGETHDIALLSAVWSLLRARLLRGRGDRVGARYLLQTPAPSIDWLRQPPRPADDPAARAEDLTARELEVLRHLSALFTTEEIAAKLFVSVNTVKTHVRHILRKLAVSNRNEAVRQAWDLNLI